MKKLIDANVILRYLLKDNQWMYLQACQAIRDGAYTVPEVLAEVVYVLNGHYKRERTEIAEALTILLKEVDITHSDMMKESLYLFSRTSLDFVDCILAARSRVLGASILTFDKKLQKQIQKWNVETEFASQM